MPGGELKSGVIVHIVYRRLGDVFGNGHPFRFGDEVVAKSYGFAFCYRGRLVYRDIRTAGGGGDGVARTVVFGFVFHNAEAGQSAEFGGAGHPNVAGGAGAVVTSADFYVVFHGEIAVAGVEGGGLASVSGADFEIVVGYGDSGTGRSEGEITGSVHCQLSVVGVRLSDSHLRSGRTLERKERPRRSGADTNIARCFNNKLWRCWIDYLSNYKIIYKCPRIIHPKPPFSRSCIKKFKSHCPTILTMS
ncbi:MAG: hypothetical protein UU20_C0036G0001 [Parcubacteria group bacterium GW2011_GWE2_40_8]|nr:MAG: hypothetical protein UU20_C0036G0001 [Parcubacteria group bacterium GW2011_GWE2_40_8]